MSTIFILPDKYHNKKFSTINPKKLDKLNIQLILLLSVREKGIISIKKNASRIEITKQIANVVFKLIAFAILKGNTQ